MSFREDVLLAAFQRMPKSARRRLVQHARELVRETGAVGGCEFCAMRDVRVWIWQGYSRCSRCRTRHALEGRETP